MQAMPFLRAGSHLPVVPTEGKPPVTMTEEQLALEKAEALGNEVMEMAKARMEWFEKEIDEVQDKLQSVEEERIFKSSPELSTTSLNLQAYLKQLWRIRQDLINIETLLNEDVYFYLQIMEGKTAEQLFYKNFANPDEQRIFKQLEARYG